MLVSSKIFLNEQWLKATPKSCPFVPQPPFQFIQKYRGKAVMAVVRNYHPGSMMA